MATEDAKPVPGPADAAQRLHRLAQDYRAAFADGAGARVLADMVRVYDGSTTHRETTDTIAASARRDVLLRLRGLIDLAAESPESLTDGLSPGQLELYLQQGGTAQPRR